VITPEGKPANADGENYCIRDGGRGCPKRYRNPDRNLDLKLAIRGRPIFPGIWLSPAIQFRLAAFAIPLCSAFNEQSGRLPSFQRY
jgi:hypothetical protein